MYCTLGTECLSHNPGSHSVCAVRTLLGVNRKILSIKKEPILSSFLTLKASYLMLEIKEFRCYEAKLEESAVHIEDFEGWWLFLS